MKKTSPVSDHRFLAFALFFAVAATAAGQTAPNRPSWGTSDKIFHPVLHPEFTPTSSTSSWFMSETDGLYSTGGSPFFTAAVRLPTGAFLTDLELDYMDTDLSSSVSLTLVDCDVFLVNCSIVQGLDSNTGPGGRSFVVADLTPLGITVDNGSQKLFLVAFMNGGATTRLLGAYIVYKLQVSPAPASATFSDVPTNHPFFRFVEALVDAGITAGCGGGNYCVNNPITRGEMAVFLAVALGLHFPG